MKNINVTFLHFYKLFEIDLSYCPYLFYLYIQVFPRYLFVNLYKLIVILL